MPVQALGNEQQVEIVERIKKALASNGMKCSTVTTETFFNAAFAAGPAAEAPKVRRYSAWRFENTIRIGHQLGAEFTVYWLGTLGYQIQGAIDEMQTLRWFADGLNAACQADIELAAHYNRPTLKHCLEAKPFEPQAVSDGAPAPAESLRCSEGGLSPAASSSNK